MKKIKSLFMVALSLLLCVCVFSGCGASKYTTLHNRNLELTDSEETFVEEDNLVLDETFKTSNPYVANYETEDISFKIAGVRYTSAHFRFEHGNLKSMYYGRDFGQDLNKNTAYDKLKNNLVIFTENRPIQMETNGK